ncbi:MAG: phosphohistidine phosphatase SixA [Proteobacteria bacterium]|nr:phosphohistidine phosphatase SixA [Pseudomonadota bacterium]
MSMFFVQHGIALDKSVDVDRPLSEQGEQNVKKIANHVARQEPNIEQVFHSGKLRSAQTARLFATILKISKVQQIDVLNPNDDVNKLMSLLEDNCMYVGHLPHMEKMLSRLLCGSEHTRIVQYENAAVVCINRDEKGYYLNWMLKPSML